jgi:zinc transporter ZupT
MTIHVVIVVVLALLFGCFFFMAEYFEHRVIQLHASFIAGISVVYFFLIVLPEIAERLPELPFDLRLFEYLFVLIGFTVIHITEKFILQKVESGTQKKMRKLMKKEKTLEAVERNMENLLTRELKNETLDEPALREIARTLSELNDQEEQMKANINRYKIKIQNRVNEDLRRFRFITDYIYHFLVGIILVGFLIIELVPGILFFFYAFFRTIISKQSESHIIFTDLEIYEEVKYDEGSIMKYIQGTSVLTGIVVGMIINAFLPENLELLFIFYSIISGVILYIIVREVIPEKEKGDPTKFIIGMIGFTIIIIFIKIFTNVL